LEVIGSHHLFSNAAFTAYSKNNPVRLEAARRTIEELEGRQEPS